MTKQTNTTWVVIGLLVALFIGALDVTVVSTAMPSIMNDLSGTKLISWVFSIYTLTTCVTTPIFGKLTDLFGRKVVFTIGVVLFVVGSILCGFSQSMVGLIWFRALQGIGAGALNPVCFTIVGDLFTGEKRGKMMGLFASVWSVAGLLGPLVGGYFVDQVNWRWIFFINVPLGVIALLLVIFCLHEQFAKQKKQIDYWGALTFTVAISALMYALLSGGVQYAWNSGVTISLFVVAIVFIVVFILIERKAAEPMMPLALFRNPIMNVSNISGFLAFAIVTGVTIYPPMWIQSVMGHSATYSGLVVMPLSLAWPLAANLVGRMMFRIGTKTSVVGGGVLVVAGSVWIAALNMDSPSWFWIGLLTVIGFGMGFLSTPQTVMIQSAFGWEMRGVAMASNSLMRSLGQTVGVAIFGTILNHYVTTGTKTELTSGMHAIFILLLAVAVVNLLSIMFYPSNSKMKEQQVA